MFLYFVLAALAAYWFYLNSRKPEKFPAGPPKLPVVGSMPFMGRHGSFLHVVKNAVEKYGPVTGFFMGSKPAVIVADFNTLKGLMHFELFNKTLNTTCNKSFIVLLFELYGRETR